MSQLLSTTTVADFNNVLNNNSQLWNHFYWSDDNFSKLKCKLCSSEIIAAKGIEDKKAHEISSNLLKHVRSHIAAKRNNTCNTVIHSNNLSLHHGSLKHTNIMDNNLLGDADCLTLTSSKSMPSSSSITKNFISRLNELSEPVKRKLKFWNKKSFQINQYDPSFKVIYLGNLGMQICSKDESCLDKPIKTLWNNYVVNMKTEIVMRLTICNSGLKAITRQHGLTQYWSNRLVYCCCHKNHPRIFAWIYRHEGKKMRQELRCHAVFCPSAEKASKMVTMLNQRLTLALQEFKREKKSNGQLVASTDDNTLTLHKLPRTIPLRRQILAKGSKNFRPPLDRSKSAPKLTSIQEEDDIFDDEDSQDELEFQEYFDNKDDDDDNEEVDSDDYEIDSSQWFGDYVPSDQLDYRSHDVQRNDGRRIINGNINNGTHDDHDDIQDKSNDDSIDSRPNPDDSPTSDILR